MALSLRGLIRMRTVLALAPVLVGIANAPAMLAQYASGDTQWEAAAGGHMAFEVASVKALKPGSRGRGKRLVIHPSAAGWRCGILGG
jgi:hypothetical protein